MRLVEIAGLHLEATTGAPVLILREHDAPHRVLPIFIGNTEAAAIASVLSGYTPPRPLTHDVMAALVEKLDAHLDRAEVTDLHEGSFLAELALRSPAGEQRLDSRPSDAIALAVRLHAPLFVSDAVLDAAGVVPVGPPDEHTIDREIDQFRSFLDDVNPADFSTDAVVPGPGSGPDQGEPMDDAEAVVSDLGDEDPEP